MPRVPPRYSTAAKAKSTASTISCSNRRHWTPVTATSPRSNAISPASTSACPNPSIAPEQLIYGDFGGSNLIFDDPLPPIVIYLSPYWRPALCARRHDRRRHRLGRRWPRYHRSHRRHTRSFSANTRRGRGELRRIIELETLLALYGRDKIDEIDAQIPLIEIIYQRCH